MDFLDPAKQRRHVVMLYVGYFLIGIIVLIVSVTLLYIAYGFGVGKNGQIVQNGLIFVSSQPNPAQIYLNGQQTNTTNTRIVLPEGIYDMKVTLGSYRDWERTVVVGGGTVEHIDYPFLIPDRLTSTPVQSYEAAPGMVTQSPDRRWLLVQRPGTLTDFERYDLNSLNSVTLLPASPVAVSLPANLLTFGQDQSLKLAEWSTDNRHVLLQHTYDKKTEYIMFDIQDPTQSVNLNKTLNVDPVKLTLSNKKYDQYFVYTADGQLETASLSSPTLQPLLKSVLSYKTYGSNVVLYATADKTKPDKVDADLLMNGKTYVLQELAAKTQYLLDLTQYSGDWFMAAGSASEGKVYIFKDPAGYMDTHPGKQDLPISVLRTPGVNYISFSPNARFIMSENGTRFGVYDAEYDNSYEYTMTQPLDQPQPNANWMNGNQLDYVSGGKLIMFDFDHNNKQTLNTASPSYQPVFPPSYKYVYSLAPTNPKDSSFSLTSTALTTK